MLKTKTRFTEEQQKEIVEIGNKFYDRGGADVLKIILDTSANLVKETPNLSSYDRYVQVLVEGIRAQLRDTVEDSEIEKEKERPLVTL